MKLYLSARYQLKPDIARVAAECINRGHRIVSTWHTESEAPDALLTALTRVTKELYAWRDLHEINQADAMLFWSEPETSNNRRGGRHVEFGYALGIPIPIYVIGPQENIFHYATGVQHFSTFTEALDALPKRRIRAK